MQVCIPSCLLEAHRFNQLQALVGFCMCLYLRRCSPCWTFQPWHGKAIPRKNWSCRRRGLEGNGHWGLGQFDGREVHVNPLSIACKSRKIGLRCSCHLPEICAKRAGVVSIFFSRKNEGKPYLGLGPIFQVVLKTTQRCFNIWWWNSLFDFRAKRLQRQNTTQPPNSKMSLCCLCDEHMGTQFGGWAQSLYFFWVWRIRVFLKFRDLNWLIMFSTGQHVVSEECSVENICNGWLIGVDPMWWFYPDFRSSGVNRMSPSGLWLQVGCSLPFLLHMLQHSEVNLKLNFEVMFMNLYPYVAQLLFSTHQGLWNRHSAQETFYKLNKYSTAPRRIVETFRLWQWNQEDASGVFLARHLCEHVSTRFNMYSYI